MEVTEQLNSICIFINWNLTFHFRIIKIVKKIKPDRIQLITATRRVANEKAKALSDEELKKIKKYLQNKRAYDKLVIEQEEQRLKNEERIRQEKADRINEIENLEFAKSVIESEMKRITDISEKEMKTAISTLKERSDKMGEYIDVSKIIEDAKKNAESEIVLQLEQSTESK